MKYSDPLVVTAQKLTLHSRHNLLGSINAPHEEVEINQDAILFMDNETIVFKDGKVTREYATYIEPVTLENKSSGNPDEETNITSRYSTHVLSWCCGKYKKKFPTPVSGLPEILFDVSCILAGSFSVFEYDCFIFHEEYCILLDLSLFMWCGN